MWLWHCAGHGRASAADASSPSIGSPPAAAAAAARTTSKQHVALALARKALLAGRVGRGQVGVIAARGAGRGRGIRRALEEEEAASHAGSSLGWHALSASFPSIVASASAAERAPPVVISTALSAPPLRPPPQEEDGDDDGEAHDG